jgi:hypothetical protein
VEDNIPWRSEQERRGRRKRVGASEIREQERRGRRKRIGALGCVSCFRAVLVHTTLSSFDANSGFICLLNWCEFGQTSYLYSHALLMEVRVSTSDEDGGFICLVKLSDVRPSCVHVLAG